MDADDELLELRKENWIDMTIFDDDNKPSVDRGSGLVYDPNEVLTHMFDRTAKHVAVIFSYVNNKTNPIEIRQTEGEDLDADDELLKLRKKPGLT